jgi:hypothetical protein
MLKFSLQLNWNGQLRIVCQEDEHVHYGDWVDYRHIATLTIHDTTYIAGTAYGLLHKSEIIYKIEEQSTTLDDSMQYIDARGVDHECELNDM